MAQAEGQTVSSREQSEMVSLVHVETVKTQISLQIRSIVR